MPDAATLTDQAFAAFDAAGLLRAALCNGLVTVRGDFRSASLDLLGIAGSGPLFVCPVSVLPDATPGDVLEIGDVRYTVAQRIDDGLGAMTLRLQKP
jgi:hypothetical protein